MFAQSHAYEPFMGRWSRRLAPLFVEFAGVQDGESVLDIGSGPGARVRDPEARPRASPASIRPRTTCQRPDSGQRGGASASSSATRALDFSDGTFDRAVSLLALNFVPDPAQALAEQIRVTRPGGLVPLPSGTTARHADAACVLGRGRRRRSAADARDERHLPLCRHSQLSVVAVAGMLAVASGHPIEQPFASFEDYWNPFLAGQGPAGAYVASLSPAARTGLSDRLRRRLTGEHGNAGGPFVKTARAWAVKGYSPARP
jgi:SAM-dependent methyltransferase